MLICIALNQNLQTYIISNDLFIFLSILFFSIRHSKMKLKDFTIIIPCISFNDAKYCIRNIRKYYKKVKIIISLNKTNKKKNTDKNLKIIISKYKAIGKKRNLAVDACKTKYLAFIDSDAYPSKNWIESTFKFLNRKNVGIVAGPHVDPPNQSYYQIIIGLVKKSFLITMLPNFQIGFYLEKFLTL